MYIKKQGKERKRKIGGGRKIGAVTALKRIALIELDEEAEKSICFLVRIRDNEIVPWNIRTQAAKDIVQMRFGTPRQQVAISGNMGAPVKINFVPARKKKVA